MKYLGITLTKYMQDVYTENYKNLVNKIKELKCSSLPLSMGDTF